MKNSIEAILARCEEVGECLEWPSRSVPQVRIESALPAQVGTNRKAPFYVRLGLWESLHGFAVPDGMVLRTTCYNQRCVNPDHQQMATHKQTIRAAYKSGRHNRSPAAQARATKARRAQPNIKLSEQIAAEIRLSAERSDVLADRYQVDKSMINRIRAGKSWRPVTSGYSVFTSLVAA